MLPLTQQDSRNMLKKGGGSGWKTKAWVLLVFMGVTVFLVSKYWEAEGERVAYKAELEKKRSDLNQVSARLATIAEKLELVNAEKNELKSSFEDCTKRANKVKAVAEEQLKESQAEVDTLKTNLDTCESAAAKYDKKIATEREKAAMHAARISALEGSVANCTKRENITDSSLKVAKKTIVDLRATVAEMEKKEKASTAEDAAPTAKPLKAPPVKPKMEKILGKEETLLRAANEDLSAASATGKRTNTDYTLFPTTLSGVKANVTSSTNFTEKPLSSNATRPALGITPKRDLALEAFLKQGGKQSNITFIKPFENSVKATHKTEKDEEEESENGSALESSASASGSVDSHVGHGQLTSSVTGGFGVHPKTRKEVKSVSHDRKQDSHEL
eukprot:TRINITY_DN875_c0_g9_i1.p1 TRINITY_DN875_c0_g9~~TRINITY_DN875_c0_g9_i1.p1  ORF type:complete len:388 (+),score=89.88 TRINITY_DN875_c0_g9_i1:74-1237(+)